MTNSSTHLGMRAALLGGVCLLSMVAAPAWAQAEQGMETVIVTGIRGELQRNLDIKRESLGLVDAITMEDIGKFPDSNLANALMRIPGVTTSMTSYMTNNGQSTVTGAGTTVTVRGFGPTFNETLFDGRVVPSGSGGRAFDFSGLSADMVSQLKVLKSPDAALSSGAIGATINVIYPKPFDHPGLTVAAAASTDINIDDGRWKPNGNFLISDTFDNDKIGVLVAGAYSSLSTSQMQYQNWGWIGNFVAPCQLAGYVGPDCSQMTSTPFDVNNGPTYVAANYDTNAVADLTHPVWFSQDYAVNFNRIQEERKNARVAVQFQPVDSLVITLDANYARDNLSEDSLTYALWNSIGEMRDIVTSSNGTVTSWKRNDAATDFDDVRSQLVQQTYSYGLNLKWTLNEHVTLTADLNQAMSATQPGDREHWNEVSEDLGYGPSVDGCTNSVTYSAYSGFATYYDPATGHMHSNNPYCPAALGNTYAPNFINNYTVTEPGGHSIPYYSNNIIPGTNFYGFNAGGDGVMGSHVMVVSTTENRNLTNEAKLESEFSYDNLDLKLGFNYTPNHFRSQSWNSFAGGGLGWQWQAGYGPDSNNLIYQGMKTFYDATDTGTYEPGTGANAGTTLMIPDTIYVDGNFPSNWVWCGGTTGIHNWCESNDSSNVNYNVPVANPIAYWTPAAATAAGTHIPASIFTGIRSLRDIPGWTSPAGGAIPGLPVFSAYDVYNYLGVTPKDMVGNGGNSLVEEDNYAGYVSFATEARLWDMPLKISGGLRYEYTKMTTTGSIQVLDSMVVSPADHTAFTFNYHYTTGSVTNAYAYLLPNIDLNLFVTDDLHVRFDASRTMTRPPLGDMNPNISYGGRVGALSANGGAPGLLPFLSDNLDLSAEWYYAPNSYVSADVFLKNVSNFVVRGTSTITVPNVIDPTTGAPAKFTYSGDVNGPTANIYGIELAWQHVFGDTGFGYLINGTIVGTNKPYDPLNLSVGNFGMPGLADSSNVMIFYDKYGFQARLAANWRDIYLDSFGQGQSSGTQFGSEPIFINGSWNLTFSTSYDITDNIRAYFEADNLTDATYSTRGRFADQLYSVISVGRSFTAGVHFKL